MDRTSYNIDDILHYNMKVLDYYKREKESNTTERIPTKNGNPVDAVIKGIRKIYKDIQLKERQVYKIVNILTQYKIDGDNMCIDTVKAMLSNHKYLIPPFARLNGLKFEHNQ